MSSDREFRKIPSLNYLYEVNEDGRIFRNVKSKKESKIIVDHHHSKAGYCFTWVNIKGKVIRVPIARVVAECFIGPKPEGLEIDHIDRNSTNNDYHNLRYVTKNIRAYVDSIKKPVTLMKDNDVYNFDSIADAARFLSKDDKNFERYRAKLKRHRSHIDDYDVMY